MGNELIPPPSIPRPRAPVTAAAIGRIIGIPPKGADEIRFRQLARRATRGIRPILTDEKRQKTEQAGVEMCEYVLGLVKERRRAPADDMISDFVRVCGPDAVTDDEIVRVVTALRQDRGCAMHAHPAGLPIPRSAPPRTWSRAR